MQLCTRSSGKIGVYRIETETTPGTLSYAIFDKGAGGKLTNGVGETGYPCAKG